MQNLPVRKILSVIFFLILLGLIFILYTENNIEKLDGNTVLIYGGLIFSSLFLLIINLSKRISKKKDLISSEKDSKEDPEKTEILDKDQQVQTEIHISEILKDIHKPADIKSLAELILKNFAKGFFIVQGVFFIKNKKTEKFQPTATYAYYSEDEIKEFEEGDGITGQAALNKNIKHITDIAEGYITVLSGLGSSSPTNLLIIPFVLNNETIAIAELAAFENFPENIKGIYSEINKPLSEKINSLI